MAGGIFSIGTSALAAAYTALRTTGHNIANANTPGYSRQSVVLSPQVGAMIGGQYVGQGVAVADVRRAYNAFLTSAAHAATANAAGAETRALQLSQINNLFADSETGIGPALDRFFQEVQSLSQRPQDAAARQSLLAAANLLAARFNDVGARLQQFRDDADTQLRLQLEAVNRTAREIAQLNDQIALARGTGRLPNDLLDRRDAAIRSLNEAIGVSSIEQSDGAINVFLGNGQALVVGSQAASLVLNVDPADPQSVYIGVRDGASVTALDADLIRGGKIGGLMVFRLQDLPAAENELGRLAVVLADQFNQQHRLGDDRYGAAGADFFRPPTPVAFPASSNGNPLTTIAVTFTDTTQLAASDYQLEYTGGQYVLTRLTDNVAWTSAVPSFSVDGLSIALANTPPANGDRFLIQAVRAGARSMEVVLRDPQRIAAAAPVRASLPAANTGSVQVQSLAAVGPTRHPALANPVTITFTGPNTYDISDGITTLTGQTYTAGVPIVFNGWQLVLHGTPAAGDQVQVQPNVGGIGDNRNALALAALQSRPLVSGGPLGGAYAATIARLGAEAQTASSYASAQRTIREDALAAESAVAGVNLDEEASRLIQYQQQYQAAAKLIATARAIFDEVLGIMR
ncbi:MAG: flagellar hook-associated protein FlgK [Sutterellaceae bacterium]|nr:flagellar hook-associated protein FlgK [Burkholderiaceae bacterium]MCX7901891.1 flagellar hook-associated protein FlgK [Burkholderiaceae bacterium]MDW8429982.1 flagellar hook-associated protein FlgK [Sutterellaceae bacterium]